MTEDETRELYDRQALKLAPFVYAIVPAIPLIYWLLCT